MSKAQLSRLLIFLATAVFVIGGTLIMIRYAKGYRPTRNGLIKGTGLLSANSYPTGAEVYINDRLTTATDNTLNLEPGQYDVRIKKDGYFTWSKKLTIKEELVTQTSATLFPTSPTLEPLTYTGALSPVPAPDSNKIVFAVASASATTKNGLYVQDLTTTPITINRAARQIARTNSDYNYAKANYTWSPNGSQILVSFTSGANLLLEADRFNDLSSLQDVTVRLNQLFREWEEELARLEKTRLAKLPEFFSDLTAAMATNLYPSPDGDKLLYQAKADFTIPTNLVPSLPASSTQPESRDVKSGSWYVYDLKEDKNFLLLAAPPAPSPLPSAPAKAIKKMTVTEPAFAVEKIHLLDSLQATLPAELGTSPSAFRKLQNSYTPTESIALFNAQYSPVGVTNVQWYPDSYHLVITTERAIEMIEYDATNRTTIYAGPFDSSFVFPWPDSSRLITRIQFSPDTVPNLYTIKLK